MTFSVNLMFRRLDLMGLYSGGRIYGGGRLIFRMLIGLHICGAHIFLGGGRINKLIL